MKKIIVLTLCAAMTLTMNLPSFALDLTAETAGKMPSTYVKKVDAGKIIFNKKSTAYSPDTFNRILENYGVQFNAQAVNTTPVGYAKVKDGKLVFGKKSGAFNPKQLHSILTAYGLTLSAADVQAALGGLYYASVKDGKIVFGSKATAYSGNELNMILAAYKTPVVEMPPVVQEMEPAPVVVEPEPEPVVVAEPDVDDDGVPDVRDVCPGTPEGANIDERGCWVLSQDYLFAFDKYRLRGQYFPILDDIVVVMNNNPGMRVELQGHTDSTGPRKYNLNLSKKRANAVRTYLIKHGVDSSRVTAVGYGESQPIKSNATREGRSKNRRVELKPIW